MAEPLDKATIAALDEAEAAIERGEVVTLEQSRINARARYKEWKKTNEQQPAPRSLAQCASELFDYTL